MATTILGKVSVTPKGAWSSGTAYEVLDIVSNSGSSYIAKQSVPAGTSLSDTDYWLLIASKGDAGYDPTVTVTPITGGHQVDITDAQGTTSFNVMDGEDGDVQSDGVYPQLTAGNAQELESDLYTTDSVPYLLRASGGGKSVGTRERDTIVGGSVVWNQVMRDVTDATNWGGSGGTISYSGGTIIFTTTGTGARNFGQNAAMSAVSVTGHKYFYSVWFKRSTALNNVVVAPRIGQNVTVGDIPANTDTLITGIQSATGESGLRIIVYPWGTGSMTFESEETATVHDAMIIDLTQMFGTAVADRIYALEQANAGAGVAYFRKLFPKPYYAYDAGTLMHVSGLVSHDTVGFNAYDAESGKSKVVGNQQYQITGTYTSLSLDGETVTPDASGYFTPDASGELTVTGGADDTCVHLVWDGERDGEYEEYELHSYALDDSLTLRGIPKLDNANNLYFDGDEYASDGTVTRRYGVVDMGTLNWGYNSTYKRFTVTDMTTVFAKPSANDKLGNILCAPYVTDIANHIDGNSYNKRIALATSGNLFAMDSSYTDAASFKAAMSGVMLVYELATPTTEEAQPYEGNQHVSKYGTEEYVSTGIVPVGHITEYPVSQKNKLDAMPNTLFYTEVAFKATRNYTVNQLISIGGQLYKANTSIASGATLTVGTNITATTLGDIITALLNA